jgi:hypothetical protein
MVGKNTSTSGSNMGEVIVSLLELGNAYNIPLFFSSLANVELPLCGMRLLQKKTCHLLRSDTVKQM